jgi:hypothetical protein
MHHKTEFEILEFFQPLLEPGFRLNLRILRCDCRDRARENEQGRKRQTQ